MGRIESKSDVSTLTSTQKEKMETFRKILEKGKMAPDCYIKLCDGTASKVCVQQSLRTFALNVYLVLHGARLAYRADISNVEFNAEMVRSVIEWHEELAVLNYPTDKEPLIFLKKNKSQIMTILKKDRNSEENIGEVLGYRYVGPRWNGSDNAVIAVWLNCSFGRLFEYHVPKDLLTEELKEKIQCDVDRFQTAFLGLDCAGTVGAKYVDYNKFRSK